MKYKLLILIVVFMSCKHKENKNLIRVLVLNGDTIIINYKNPKILDFSHIRNSIYTNIEIGKINSNDTLTDIISSPKITNTIYIHDTIYRSIGSKGEVLYKVNNVVSFLPPNERSIKYVLDNFTYNRIGFFLNVMPGTHTISVYVDDKYSGDNPTNFAINIGAYSKTTKTVSSLRVMDLDIKNKTFYVLDQPQ